MKIAYITPAYPPYGGGIGKVTKETSERLEEKGHEVVVFTPDYENRGPEGKNIKKVKPKFPAKKLVSKFISVENATFLPQIKQDLNNFDIVHLHYPFFGTDRIVYKWKKKNPGIPLVITYHMDVTSSGIKGIILYLYRKFYQRRILSCADKLIASTFDYIENSFARENFKNHKEKWKELPFGVDLNQFQPTPVSDEFKDKFDLDSNKKTILFVGGMDRAHEFKGVPVLLEALRKISDKINQFQAVFVGSGELQSKFKKIARQKGIESKTNFVGFVEEKHLSDFYSFADVTVLPSESKNEAFGLVLLESFACGTSVIASDLPGVRTIAKKSGTTFEVGSSKDLSRKLLKFLDGDVDVNQPSREAAKSLSWSDRTDELIKVYQNML
ncbi:MAG: glycosyltransferase family 4 protein [Candidatus Magasanikbacteria bacterium]